MVHESWYLQFILNLHISSYLLVSLAHPLLSFVPFSVASDGRRVWSRRDGKLNAKSRRCLVGRPRLHQRRWEKCATITVTILHIDYKSSNNHSWHCWLNNIHPSLLNSSSFRHFEALWNQLAHLPTPRAKFEEPVGILPRASHLQQNSQPSICGWPCQLLWRRNLWRQVPKWVWKPDNG